MWWLVLLVSQLALVTGVNEGCSAGMYLTGYEWYTDADGHNPICETCLIGSYSQSGYTECVSCPAGTYSTTAGAASCTLCARGKYKSNAGAGTCTSCAAGYVASNLGTANCASCLAGT